MDESANDVTVSAAAGGIEAEIAQTRREMRETISAIQDRLAPSYVLQRAKESARDATVGRVKQMAHELGTRASGLSDNARSAAEKTARDNPMPLALIGLGIGWLVARSVTGSRRGSYNTSSRTDWSSDPWAEDEWSGGNRRLSTAEERTAPGATDRATQMLESTRETVRDVTSRGRESMSSAARRTQSGLERALNNNPLALGVATLAAGLAVGALIPRTEAEDEYLGTTRDTVLHKAQNAIAQTDSGSHPGATT
jgi:hypothetical protein